MHVKAMTSNIKEIKGTIINLKSSKYMYIDKSESENNIENSMECIGTHKHVMPVQVSKQEIRKSHNDLESYIVKQNVQLKYTS